MLLLKISGYTNGWNMGVYVVVSSKNKLKTSYVVNNAN